MIKDRTLERLKASRHFWGGGSSPAKTNVQYQNVNREPWGPSVEPLKTALGGAMDAYNTTYKGPQVAGMDANVTQGQNDILANANNGDLGRLSQMGLSGMGDMLGNGGLSSSMRSGLDAINTGIGGLSSYANGSMLKANPYLDATLGKAMGDAANTVNAQFSAGGRYGSGAQADALGSRLGSIEANARMADYNQQQQNQLSAASALGSLGSQYAGIGQQGIGNLMNAGAGLNSLSSSRNADALARMGVGGQRMDYQQQLIDSANQAPWQRVGNLANIATGIGGMGGSTTGFSFGKEEQTGGNNGVAGGILSGLGVGANLLKSLGGAGGLGSFLPFFSDERMKEDIEEVGKLNDGQKVYSYKYKGDPRKQIGLLAQEVERKRPNAVRTHASGMKMVDYGKATAKAVKGAKRGAA